MTMRLTFKPGQAEFSGPLEVNLLGRATSGLKLIDDNTDLGTLTEEAAPLYLLASNAAGTKVRKVTPGALGLSLLLAEATLTLTAQDPADTPLTITGDAAQTANLQSWVNGNSGKVYVSITKDGGLQFADHAGSDQGYIGPNPANLSQWQNTLRIERITTGSGPTDSLAAVVNGGSGRYVIMGPGDLNVTQPYYGQWVLDTENQRIGTFGGVESGYAHIFRNPTATDVTAAWRAANGQTVNVTEWQDSTGTVKALVSPGEIATGFDDWFFGIQRGGRSYRIGSYDAAGAFVFARSDSDNGLQFVPNPGNVVLIPKTGKLVLGAADNPIVLTPSGGGGAGYIEMGQRESDSSSAVGAIPRVWTVTGQTENAFQVLAPGGGSQITAVRANGAWMPASLADASAANNSVYYSTDAGKLVYKDSGGTVNNLY